MKFPWSRQRIKVLSLILLCLMAFNSASVLYLSEYLPHVFADTSTGYVTVPVDYKPGDTNQLFNGKFYSKASSVYGYVSVASGSGGIPSGRTITMVEYKGVNITPSTGAVGRNSLSEERITVNGNELEVSSSGNDAGTKGYYAWFRYIPTDPHKLNWYADVTGGDGNIHRIACGPSSDTTDGTLFLTSGAKIEHINGNDLPTVPNCSSANFPDMRGLGLDAYIDKPYKTSSGVTVPYQGVVAAPSSTSAEVNEAPEISGPTGTGFARKETITNISVQPDSSDASKFRILFDQKFTDFLEGYDSEKDLAAPAPPTGAKVRVWFAAFIAKISGISYEYDTSVKVYYDTPTGAANLAVSALTGPTCVQVGQTTSFSFSFTNTGGTDISTPFNARVLIDGTLLQQFNYTGLNSGQSITGTFTKSFGGTSSYGISIIIDSVIGESSTADNSKGITITPQTSCTAPEQPETINAAFEIEKPRLKFGDDNTIRVTDVVITGGNSCKYLSNTAVITQEDKTTTWTSNGQVYGFNGLPYPNGIGIGIVYVHMAVKSTCGTVKDLGTKSFEIYIDNTEPNSPPVFTPGFVNRGNSGAIQPLINVTVGTNLDLQIIHTPEMPPNTKATPYDPDGDAIIYIWDFENTDADWIKSKFDEMGLWAYDERYSYFVPDKLGTFSIKVTAMDRRGASSTKTATINVVPPNPVPVITLPSKVIEGRAFTPEISGANSYSPFGYAIKQYIWDNKQTMYPTAGTQAITLDVVDSNNLHALTPASATLNVQPDLPPIAQAFVPPTGLRNNQMVIQDTSYSPDNDPILTHTDTITCDSNNNGSFTDETSTTVTRDASGNINYAASRVGNCKLAIFIQEAEGYKKSDLKEYFFEIQNEQPVSTFAVAGQVQPPALDLPKSYTVDDLMSSDWKTGSLDGDMNRKAWWYKNASGNLQTLPIFQNSPKFTGQMSPYNAPNLSNLTPRDVVLSDYVSAIVGPNTTIGMNASKTQWEIRENGNLIRTITHGGGSASNPNNMIITPDTLQLAYANYNGNSCSEGLNTYWFSIPISMLWNTSYSPMTVMNCGIYTSDGSGSLVTAANMEAYGRPFVWSSKSPQIGTTEIFLSKIVDGNTIWQINEADATGYTPKYDPIVAYNEDLTRIAELYCTDCQNGHNTGYHLKIRDGANGSVVKDIVMSKSLSDPNQSFRFLGFYKNMFIVRIAQSYSISINDDRTLYAYNYNGDLIWTSTAIDPKGDISKDGYIVGVSSSTDSTTHARTYYVQVVDINTGTIVSQVPFDTLPSPAGSYTLATNGVRILDNGKVYVNYGYKNKDSEGNFYSKNFEKILEGSTYNTGIKETYLTYGQLYNASVRNQNAEYMYSLTFKSGLSKLYNALEPAGFSFRMKDSRNMYRIEHTLSSTKLVSYVNGTRTVIDSINWPFTEDTGYSIRIKVNGTSIKLYINGSPVINKNDSTLTEAGSYGPFSTKGNVQFKAISVLDYPATQFVDNVVVVGQPITYNTSYSDLENDPAMPSRAKWTFTNQQPYKYLNSGDGYSEVSPSNSYNNVLVTSPNPTLGKVGYYKVDYQIPDDPSPPGHSYADGLFSSYSQYSDPYTQMVKVVRVPIAQFTIQKNANNTLSPIDTSYDPDRWLSASNYQTGYGTNRGIFDQKWKYTAPDGSIGYGFPTNPNQTGTYIVSLVVMQEDGIWSEWYDQSINVVIAVPNSPPTAALTFPSGTQASPSYVNTLLPTVSWNESDPDTGTIFASFHIVIKDVSGNVVVDSGIRPLGTTASSAQWTLDQSLVMGQEYQVQVAVNDGMIWSAWSNIGWLITNRPPIATMTVPNGTQAAPTIFSSLRPTLQWNQTDPDPGTTFSYFQLQIMNEANTITLVDSGQYWEGSVSSVGSWTPNQDLPTGQKLRVRVRVFDGMIWSDYSEQTWLYINRAPIADFDWSPKPVWEGDDVQIMNASTDADGDVLTYAWRIEAPDGAIQTFTSANILEKFMKPGDYKVTLAVTDGILTSTVVKVIKALPLTILSNVTYTDQWLILHNKRGHQTVAAPKQFYSGEILVVSTQSSAAPVDEVTAWIDTLSLDGHSLYITEKLVPELSDRTLFKGELFDNQFQSFTEGLPRGIQTIHFKIRYHNGVVKTEDIPIEIIGNVEQSVGVHRVQ